MENKQNVQCRPEKLTMNVDEIAREMGICKPRAYELVKSDGFPALFVGKRIVVPVESFRAWLAGRAASKRVVL